MSEVEHETTVRAPAQTVYGLLADAVDWPRIFPPTLHVERIERSGLDERIRVWATANGQPRTWTSVRTFDPNEMRIDFRQEVSPRPVDHMRGSWVVEPLADRQTKVRLLHSYRAIDDNPDDLAQIDRAVDVNSRSELAALKSAAELTSDLSFSFQDSVQISGTADQVYDFVNDAAQWVHRLPHVVAVTLEEPVPGIQTLEMDTLAQDGSTHTTKSYRVCLPAKVIAYKQTVLPPALALHTGQWRFQPNAQGVLATSEHTVVLTAEYASAREQVRKALSTNSLATLSCAKTHVEAGR